MRSAESLYRESYPTNLPAHRRVVELATTLA